MTAAGERHLRKVCLYSGSVEDRIGYGKTTWVPFELLLATGRLQLVQKGGAFSYAPRAQELGRVMH